MSQIRGHFIPGEQEPEADGFFDSVLRYLAEHRKAFLSSPFIWAFLIGLLYNLASPELKKALDFILLFPKK
jgi:hypothetical protein